jgi:hypothetical protein
MLPVPVNRPQAVRLLRKLVHLLVVILTQHDAQLLGKAVKEVEGEELGRLLAGGTQLQHVS